METLSAEPLQALQTPILEPSVSTIPVKNNGNKYMMYILILLVGLFIVYMITNNKSQNCSDLFTDDVVYYFRASCPYCIKQLEVFNENGVINKITTCDLSNEDCKQSFDSSGAMGVPYFMLKSDNSVTTTGLNTDMCALSKKLKLK
jgi:glutaredoxin